MWHRTSLNKLNKDEDLEIILGFPCLSWKAIDFPEHWG